MRSTNSTIQLFNRSTIIIANRQRVKRMDSRLLKEIAATLLTELKIVEAEIGINLVGEREMTLVNESFLKHEGSTDVITFDYGEKRKAESGKRKCICGEIFISIDDAIAQARQFKSTWQSEIVCYVVHGVLHLLGHDDLHADLRRKMKREENRLLRKLSKKFSLAQIGGSSKLRA
jgi:probable rRNA maturation factor